jgi:hypothetical protein
VGTAQVFGNKPLPPHKNHRWRDADFATVTVRIEKSLNRFALCIAESFNAQERRFASIEIQATNNRQESGGRKGF